MSPLPALLPRLDGPGGPSLPLSREQKRALAAYRARQDSGIYPTAPLPCLCGGAGAEDVPIARRDRYGIPLDTVLCRRCGLMRSDPYFTGPALDRFYREDYRALYSPLLGADGIFADELSAGEHLHRWLHVELGLPRWDLVFEIGCGAGGVLEVFRGEGAAVAGCDFDEAYLRYGRSRSLPLELGGVETLAPYGRASLVILRHVVEHLRDPVGELRRYAGALVPGGHVCVELPGILEIRRTYGDVALFLQNAHAWHFCRTTLDFTMSLAGFVPVAGDEVVRALYRHEPGTAPRAPDAGCAGRILAELVSLERSPQLRRWVALRRFTAVVAHRLLGAALFGRIQARLRRDPFVSGAGDR